MTTSTILIAFHILSINFSTSYVRNHIFFSFFLHFVILSFSYCVLILCCFSSSSTTDRFQDFPTPSCMYGDCDPYHHITCIYLSLTSSSSSAFVTRFRRSPPRQKPVLFSVASLTNADFENPRAFKQYNRQRPIGMQVLVQFELQELNTSLVLNELVLWRHDTLFDIGDWIPARVVGQNNNLTYHIRTETHRVARSVRRGLLRRLDFDAEAPPLLDVGARVLVPIVERDCWRQGTVLSRLEDGTSHNVRLYTGKELVVKNIGQLMKR